MFCNCNYEATIELCSTPTIRRAAENYNTYYAKLQCVLCKTTATLLATV